jgi:hypothetical protein
MQFRVHLNSGRHYSNPLTIQRKMCNGIMTYEQTYNCGVQGYLLTLNTAAQEVPLLVYSLRFQ